MADKYLIGDTIRFTGAIVKLDGVDYDPPVITVSVFKKNGECLLNQKPADYVSKGSYKYDWTIKGTDEVTLAQSNDLIVIWDWSGPHKKRLNFMVIPQV